MTYRLIESYFFKNDVKDNILSSQEIRWHEQRVTAEIILNHFNKSIALILGDEVGMGKTWVGILAALSVAQKSRVLILTPNRVIANQWCEQFRDLVAKKFLEDQRVYLNSLLMGEDSFNDFEELLDCAKKNEKGIFITSFNAIDPTDPGKKYANRMKDDGFFELLIIDEGHKFKNSFTEKYQIFSVTKTGTTKTYREPLKHKFKRLLIMTATPFQLNHSDLKIILGIANSSFETEDLKDKFKYEVDNLINGLNNYKSQLETFKKVFSKFKTENEIKFLENAVLNKQELDFNVKSYVKDAVVEFNRLIINKQDLNKLMISFIIRNTKSKEKRKEIEKPIFIDEKSSLTFFLGDSLYTTKLRDDKSHHQASILTSSFSRFEELHITESNTASVRHYSELVRSLKEEAFKNSEHPKIDLIVNHVFENWLKGNKTLVFAFYTKTIEELNLKVQEKISNYVNSFKVKYPEGEVAKFLNEVGQSDNISSLVFRDNPFLISLLPLLNLKFKDEEVFEFLVLNENEMDLLINYLVKLKYPKKSHNFFKLLTALCHVLFIKFKKLYPNSIPLELKDDFETICDPNASMFKDVNISHSNINDEEANKKHEILDNLKDFINNSEKIKQILFHPTIWMNHSKDLELLNMQERLALTEVVWSYLTTDEYIFLELLNGKNEIPSISDFPEIYSRSINIGRESTFSKITRLLKNAKDMDKKNLQILLGDISRRYIPNKRNVGKIIVETVSGENSADEKHRSVTAFKTPLAPNILISSSVLAEGVDLHKECDEIIHYDHEWNPANLEQKIGRLDRVGSKGEISNRINIYYPYISGTQDEKAFNIVMARKSWFSAVMGEKYEDNWKIKDTSDHSIALPQSLQNLLTMNLGNSAFRLK